jgi:hypothetical protein
MAANGSAPAPEGRWFSLEHMRLEGQEYGRPILEYVRTLESRVREYQSRDFRYRGRWFTLGFASGVFLMVLAALALRLFFPHF